MNLVTATNSAVNAAATVGGETAWLVGGSINPDCWAYGLSANRFHCRAKTGPAGVHGGPTLIREVGTSTRFAVTASHLFSGGHPAIGSTCTWLKGDNSTLSRTVADYRNVGDICIVRLSAAIDYADVEAAFVPTPAVWDYVNGDLAAVTVHATFADPTLRIAGKTILTSGSTSGVVQTIPSAIPLNAFDVTMVAGDSGSPLLSVIDGQEVIWTTWYYPTYGPSLEFNREAVAAACTAMVGSAVTLADVDLSAFTAVPPTLSIGVSDTVVQPNEGFTLTWSSSRSSISVSGDNGIGAMASTGSTTLAITEDTTFTITAVGLGGATVRSVTVRTAGIPMAYFLWVGTGPNQNFNVIANWRNSNGAKADLGPAEALPTAADGCWAPANGIIGDSTSPEVGVSGVCYGAWPSQTINGIYGNSLDMPEFRGAITSDSQLNAYYCHFYVRPVSLYETYEQCEFWIDFASVDLGLGCLNCEFHGDLTASPASVDLIVITGCTIHGDATIAQRVNDYYLYSITNNTFLGRVRSDLLSNVWLYQADSTHAAPPASVVAPATNLGVAGTARKASIGLPGLW